MTREYESKQKIKGWYYDLQSNPETSRLTCVSLHPNTKKNSSGDKWEAVSDTDDDDNIYFKDGDKNKYKYSKTPICTAITTEDFNIAISNSWTDFGGDMLGQMWESMKSLAPYTDFIQENIVKISENFNNASKSIKNTVNDSKVASGIQSGLSKIANDIKEGRLDPADYLNRSLVVQGTRFSYYSGTGTSFGGLSLKFTVFPKWNGESFITVNSQIDNILPYVMGEFETEDAKTDTVVDGLIGWQKPPAGFRANIHNVDTIQFGTLKLKIGPYYSINNLVCDNAMFNYSRQMVKSPAQYITIAEDEPESFIISPLYCEVTLSLKPITKYSDKFLRNFAFGKANKTSVNNINKALDKAITSEKKALKKTYGGMGILTDLF